MGHCGMMRCVSPHDVTGHTWHQTDDLPFDETKFSGRCVQATALITAPAPSGFLPVCHFAINGLA